jgi:hypothetical protein
LGFRSKRGGFYRTAKDCPKKKSEYEKEEKYTQPAPG